MVIRTTEERGRQEAEQAQERRRSDDDDDEEEEELEATSPAAVTAETEKEAISLLAAAWETGSSSVEQPVPDDAVRGYIKEYNGLITELCPEDGTVPEGGRDTGERWLWAIHDAHQAG